MKKIKIITLVFNKKLGDFDTEKLDEFLSNNVIEKEFNNFFQIDDNVYWSFAFHYNCNEPVLRNKHLPTQDDTGTLNDNEKLLFQKLKIWRQEKAKSEGISSYIICHNSQLIQIIKTMPDNLEKLKTIKGIGKMKAEKYGKEILEVLNNK